MVVEGWSRVGSMDFGERGGLAAEDISWIVFAEEGVLRLAVAIEGRMACHSRAQESAQEDA